MASWLNVRTRLTSFAVLRALGTTPRQIASVLLWEQGIVYATALFLGIIFGVLLSLTVVPALIFTSITPGTLISNNDFYALQQIIPAQLVAPFSLGIAFLVLIVILVVALVMMLRVILRRSMRQALRLSVDGRMNFLSREEELVITRSTSAQNANHRPRRSLAPSLLTLTLWRLRQVRFLLLLTCIGITAAVMIVCAVPTLLNRYYHRGSAWFSRSHSHYFRNYARHHYPGIVNRHRPEYTTKICSCFPA